MRFLTLIGFIVLPFLALAKGTGPQIDPVWTSVLPPLITIVLALIFREVIFSLLIGVLAGLLLVASKTKSIGNSIGSSILEVPMSIKESLYDRDHLSVIIFTLMIGAMVSIISKNGGMMAVVRKISAHAKSSRAAQLSTWTLGIAIFFDDYANTLVVGKTMQPLMDKMKVSREKLAYIVDSTAAPIASVAFITTWIGAEIGYIKDGIDGIQNGEQILGSAYSVFLNSLQFSFYPVLTIFFIFLLIWKRKDFGTMYKAEMKARNSETNFIKDDDRPGDVDDIPDNKEKARSALIPIFVLLSVAIGSIIYTGLQSAGWQDSLSFAKNLSQLIGSSDAYQALIWASFLGLVAAVLMTVIPRIMSIATTVEHAMEGIKIMMPAIAILTLAWTLSSVTQLLGTGDYLASVVQGSLNPHLIPSVVFILSAIIAFSTGTSWGTMSILYPIALVTSWEVCMQAGLSQDLSLTIFANVVSAVLAGAVLGDHCSPISDTTILSSLASDCDHISHVRTQLPYALTVGSVSVLLGTLPAGFGVPWYLTFPIAGSALYFIVSYFGKMVPDARKHG